MVMVARVDLAAPWPTAYPPLGKKRLTRADRTGLAQPATANKADGEDPPRFLKKWMARAGADLDRPGSASMRTPGRRDLTQADNLAAPVTVLAHPVGAVSGRIGSRPSGVVTWSGLRSHDPRPARREYPASIGGYAWGVAKHLI
jgi:hypothetical protein